MNTDHACSFSLWQLQTHTRTHLHKPRNVSKGIIPPQRCGGDTTGEQGGQLNTGLNRAIQSQRLPLNNVPGIHSTHTITVHIVQYITQQSYVKEEKKKKKKEKINWEVNYPGILLLSTDDEVLQFDSGQSDAMQVHKPGVLLHIVLERRP